jgi:hypothetical protein
MDIGVVWSAVGAVGTVAAAGIAAWAATQSRSSAEQANLAAGALADIERDRRHSELTPRFWVRVEPWGAGMDVTRLRVMLVGPPGLDHLDSLTVRIRDDHFRRGEGTLLAVGPSREQVKDHIWGPYMFTPGTGPDEARADRTGRVTAYEASLPVGEELPFQLDKTRPGSWMGNMSQEDWQRQRGTVIRLALEATHNEHGSWTLPCEIDVEAGTTRSTSVSRSGSRGVTGGGPVVDSGVLTPDWFSPLSS